MPQDQLQCLSSLEGADCARQDPQDASFRARRDHPGRGRLREKAAIAGAAACIENTYLAFEAIDRPVNVWLTGQNTYIVDQIARREIIGAVDQDIVILGNAHRIFRGKRLVESVYLNFRVEIFQAILGRIDFEVANATRAMDYLAL